MESYWDYIHVNYESIKFIADELRLPVVIARILVNRGYDTIEEAKRFLEPTLEDLHDPFLMNDMEKTAGRLLSAIENKEKICIYGDYDVDGVTSIIILHDALQRLGAQVTFTIPHRLDEGYGLNLPRIKEIVDENDINLLVTVDCGTTSVNEVKFARETGLEVIITDHHEEGTERPSAFTILNPKLSDNTYPHKELAGVGVIFKLAQALETISGKKFPLDTYLGFAAIGTIADIVPLVNENRIIARLGLAKLPDLANLGLKILLSELKLEGKKMQSSDISFRLAPRVNALGRLGNVEQAVELFFTTNRAYGKDIVSEMNRLNAKRQQLESKIFNEAVEKIESDSDLLNAPVLIVAGEDWHLGVIGIVASRLTNKYYKPSLVISLNNDTCKASGRSIPGFDLKGAIDKEADLLESYGGHKMAVGFQIKKNKIQQFTSRLNKQVNSILDGHLFVRQDKIDADVALHNVDNELLDYLDMLKPFGHSNPKPVFRAKGVKINGKPYLLKNQHIKMKLEARNTQMDAICWKKGEWLQSLKEADTIDVVFHIVKNTWQGIEQIQIEVLDFTPHND